MITNAGRLSSTTSQGSPSRSARRKRPIRRPMAEPTAIAIVNDNNTRHSVMSRLNGSSQDWVSCTMASATVCGSGNMRGPATRDPAYQAAINSRSESSLTTTSAPRGQAVERSGIELTRRADQLGAADLSEHAVERARIGLLLGQRAPHDALAVALAIDREGGGIGSADARREPPPFRLRGGQDFLGLADRGEEAVDRGAVLGGPGAVEGIAKNRHRALGAERAHDIVHGNGAPVALGFELGAEIPEGERGVVLALHCLLR